MSVNIANPVKLLLTPREAAQALSVSERTLWSITTPRGDLPCVRLAGRTVRYDVATLRRWLAERQSNGGAHASGGRGDGRPDNAEA